VIIPAYNEAEAIGQTITELQQTLSAIKCESEILVVDDGSIDSTPATASLCGVRVIRHPRNAGYGRALLTGIDVATYDNIVIVDADTTYPIEYLPELLALYGQGFDMVVGARQGRHYKGSFIKQILRAIFRFLAEFTCGRSIPDINSGFRVFRRGPVLAERSSLSPGFSFTTTITLLFMLKNLFVAYLPIPYRGRVGKSKVRLVSDGLRSLQIIVTAIAQFNPLKLFLLLFLTSWTGILILAVLSWALAWLGPGFWLMLAVGWGVGMVISALAILSLVLLRT